MSASSDIIAKKCASTLSDDACDEVNDILQNMSTVETDVVVLVCANCGKEGDDVKNICNKCKQVTYCNAVCKKVHKKKHKKQCEEHIKLAAEKHGEELRLAAELHDEKLFKEPPAEDCPICFLRLPEHHTGRVYKTCCGKTICSGCVCAPVYDDQGNRVEDNCPFCRAMDPTDEEMVETERKRVEANDPIAIFNHGVYYRDGINGFPQDMDKALKMFHKAGKLGSAEAYTSIGIAYSNGEGVEVDEEKAEHYYEVAAIMGCEFARHNLGLIEMKAGNMDRGLKHYMIAVRSGHSECLNQIKELYTKGHATKEEYTKALKLYQTYLGEIKSDQRDKAAAADDGCRYY